MNKKYLAYIGAFALLFLGVLASLIKMPIWLLITLELVFMAMVIIGCKEMGKQDKEKEKISTQIKHIKDKIK